MIPTDEKLRRLIEAVNLLAATPSQQLGSFPQWLAKGDEIALTFDDSFSFADQLSAEGRLSDEQLNGLRAVEQRFAAMSAAAKPELWSDEALVADENWQWLRQHATHLLKSFAVPPHAPHLDWLTFLRDES